MKTLIRKGTIITASDTLKADILIEGEKIQAIGQSFLTENLDEIIDAEGKLIMPGGVDVHTHLELPMFGTVSSDDHYTGHKAAAFGGTTTVLDFVSQDADSLEECVRLWHEKADHKAAVDYSFHMNISKFDESIAEQIPHLRELGINSVKVFTAYNNRLRLGDGDIFKVMRIAKGNGMLVLVHCENGDVIDVLVKEALQAGNTSPIWHARTRPAGGAAESVYRSIKLAEMAGSPVYIVHMNTKEGASHVRRARLMGMPVMGETCPQYMFFPDEKLEQEDGARWICSPPLRSEENRKGIWKAVEDRTMQVIATDHCPFFYNGCKPIMYEGKEIAIPGKELGKDDFTKIPNGLPGVGDRMMILWTYGVLANRITPNHFVSITSTNPAKIFGLYPQKGTLQPGSDADIAVWDPEKEITYGADVAKHRTDHNLYEGWKIKSVVEKVFLRGKLIVDGEKWFGEPGGGNYIFRKEINAI